MFSAFPDFFRDFPMSFSSFSAYYRGWQIASHNSTCNSSWDTIVRNGRTPLHSFRCLECTECVCDRVCEGTFQTCSSVVAAASIAIAPLADFTPSPNTRVTGRVAIAAREGWIARNLRRKNLKQSFPRDSECAKSLEKKTLRESFLSEF